MGDREIDFLGVQFRRIVANQELGFSESHSFSTGVPKSIDNCGAAQHVERFGKSLYKTTGLLAPLRTDVMQSRN